jgi:hypothetical protein
VQSKSFDFIFIFFYAMSMFTSGFGVPFGTLVVPSSTTGSSPPRDDGDSIGKSGRGLFDGSRGTGMCVLCVGDIRRTICGGAVGISGMTMRINTVEECAVMKHREFKASLKIVKSSASDHYACIIQRNKKTVFTNLVVPVELFGSVWLSHYETQTRQHGQWEMLFRGFLAPGAEPDTEPELCEFEDSVNKRGLVEKLGLESLSPLKKPKATPKSSRRGGVIDLTTSLEANPSSE